MKKLFKSRLRKRIENKIKELTESQSEFKSAEFKSANTTERCAYIFARKDAEKIANILRELL